jgi:hypothetical protein
MNRTIIFSSLLGLVLGATASTAHAELPLAQERIGRWQLTVFARPGGHCTLAVREADGAHLTLGIMNDQSWRLGIGASSWTVPVGAWAPITYRIDRNDRRTGNVASVSPASLVMPLPRDGALIDELGTGAVLHVDFNGETRPFSLAGLSAALPKLSDCARRYGNEARETPTPAVPAVKPLANIDAAHRETKTEAARWAERIVDDGTMPRVSPMTSDGMKLPDWGNFFRNAVAGWNNDEVLGRLEIYEPRRDALISTAVALYKSSLEKCSGDYTFRRLGRDDRVIGLYIDCVVASVRMPRAYVLFKDKNGFLYYASFASVNGDGGDDTGLVAEDFLRAGIGLLAQQ